MEKGNSSIYLRALEIEDYKLLTMWRNDRDVTKLLGANYYFVSAAREKNWLEEIISNDAKNLRLAICLKGSQKHIGNVNLTSIDLLNKNAEFSIFIGDKSEWGKGFASEACLLMLDHAFHQLNLERIYLYVLEEHNAAIKLYKKCGFTVEGVFRNNVFKDDKYHNSVIMSILKSEYNA
jgi:RimJ/RimL family protein N-acetyltransferase